MKTLLAAALVFNAHSHDETSLMQGLARRVDGKLGFDGAKKSIHCQVDGDRHKHVEKRGWCHT